MRKIHKIFTTVILSCFVFSCDDPIVEDKGYEAPLPPTSIIQQNIMNIEFYSRLNEQTLFLKSDIDPIINHINQQNTSLAYIFDRADATIGESSKVVQIALETRTKAFFVQNDIDDKHITGTGILVRPIINAFEGIGISDTLYVGGCTLTAPLGRLAIVNIATTKIQEAYQYKALVRAMGDGMQTNKILIGTVKKSFANEMEGYLKSNMKDFRFTSFNADAYDAAYQLFVLSPLSFVTRDIVVAQAGNLPMYQCKIEYIYEEN